MELNPISTLKKLQTVTFPLLGPAANMAQSLFLGQALPRIASHFAIYKYYYWMFLIITR